ncbi:MAG: SPOR domain-containing protein [Candidatus Omnitrophica bacterium]|nr:SPOR domain-containing protein [Candidatus Omnitrophota bacterium]
MKKIFLVFVIITFFCLNFNSSAYDRNEKRALEKIEALFLKEDFQAVKTKCDRFLRDYRRSRLRRKVRNLRDIATRKLSEKNTRYAIRDTQYEKELYYIVQIGAFKKYKNAVKLKRSLGRQGFDSVILKVRKGKRIFYRVRAGKFRKLENARNLVRSLKKKGYSSEIINEE